MTAAARIAIVAIAALIGCAISFAVVGLGDHRFIGTVGGATIGHSCAHGRFRARPAGQPQIARTRMADPACASAEQVSEHVGTHSGAGHHQSASLAGQISPMTALLTAASVKSMGDLPLIEATGLTRAQRLGRACVSCHKRFPRPTVAVGQTGAGDLLYRCPDCVVVLEPLNSRSSRVLTVSPESGRSS